jgi:2-C-methyl-D-erythritol 2,4-cyclodiphosphate synthase
MKIRTGLGQDSHRFDKQNKKACIIGGIEIHNADGLKGNSDADVVLHAITNAISGITGVNILGGVADELCKEGILDSSVYLEKALEFLGKNKISHVSISIECKIPKITPHIETMKNRISDLLSIETSDIGITATTGEGLTDFGRGEGIQAFAIITTMAE